MDYFKLAAKYDTPLYVYDFDKIAKNYLALKEAFKARKSLIAYALKANSNMSLIKMLANLGSGADCVSIGEIK
ncbi:MAG: diaminopimelate decarboxylase, partial [Epsilonproteobacteria bacterium]|nr:diaminopimelate decarboxylase [Campylobacterota bacterium]